MKKIPRSVKWIIRKTLEYWRRKVFQRILKKNGFSIYEARIAEWIFKNAASWAMQMAEIGVAVSQNDTEKKFKRQLGASRTGKAMSRARREKLSTLTFNALGINEQTRA